MRLLSFLLIVPVVAASLVAGEVEAPPIAPIAPLPPIPLIKEPPKGSLGYSGPLKNPAEKMAFSPDGTRIVVNGSGGHIQVLDSNALNLLKDIETGIVNGVDFSADGKEVLCAGPGNDVTLWNLETGKITRTFTGHTAEVRAVVCSPDGSRVASTDSAGTLRIWNFSDAKAIFTLNGQKYPEDPPTEALTIEGLAFSPDGRFIVTEADDAKARVWDAVRGVELRVVRDHDGKTASQSISPSGTVAASSRAGGLLRIWKLENGNVVRVFSGHEADVTCSVFSVDEVTVFSGSEDKTVRQWDIETGVELRRFTLGSTPTALAISTDGKRLFTLSFDAGVAAWDLAAVPLSNGQYADVVTSLDAAWMALASAEYHARAEAIGYFVRYKDSPAAIQFILNKLNVRSINENDCRAQEELLAKLDDAAYATRLKAAEDLKKMGQAARESLTRALKNPSSEVRAKVAELLRDLGGSIDARGVLAAEIFSLMHSPASRDALIVIASKDGPGAMRAKAMLASVWKK